jgi:hypothetical protein
VIIGAVGAVAGGVIGGLSWVMKKLRGRR